MCGNSERKEALASQGCFTERRGASQDWKAAAKHKLRMARQQGGLGEELTLGECREGDCRAQGHGWKGGGTENKGEVYRVGTSVFLNRE